MAIISKKRWGLQEKCYILVTLAVFLLLFYHK